MAPEPTATGAPGDADFFARLPRMARTADTFDTGLYGAAPDDWWLVVTDIVDSTQAVAAGRHKTVNFVGATAIGALKNLCAPTPLPFLFGGDGCVVMVPPQFAPQARVALARVQGFARREFGMQLRAGLADIATLRRHGGDVRVGRFEPTPGNSFGVFLGGGVAVLENAVRGRGDAALAAQVAVDPTLDDGQPPDLEGLSCRWNPLQSTRGRMLTLIVQGAADPGAVHARVMALAGGEAATRPTQRGALRAGWPPQGLRLEALVRRGRRPLWWAALGLLVHTLLARIIFRIGRPVGGFDPERYLDEIASNTDFCKHDDTLSLVIDCPLPAIETIRAYLDAEMARGALRYGTTVSETALMTCLVTSPSDHLHVHFVDGGDGGYTRAAKGLKALARLPADAVPPSAVP